jgi:hypothetical protein
MEANSSSVLMLPTQGDFATGVRTQPDVLRFRGAFAAGMTRSTKPLPQRHGDFAAGIRARMHDVVAHHGDFALGLRVAESPATA